MTPIRAPLLLGEDLIHLKAECLQPGGSYKTRGVARVLSRSAIPPQGFSTVSAGNLGRSLAAGCQSLKIPCTVYVPDGAPAQKKDKIEALGANLVELPFSEIWKMLLDPPEQDGFIHPTRSLELRSGYADIARELAKDLPDLGAVVVPFGLGGLFLGMALELRRLLPRVKIFAAELNEQAPLSAAMGGRAAAVGLRHGRNFVDAIGTPALLPEMLEQVRPLLAGSITVTLEETRGALSRLHQEHSLVVEGAAAVAYAAATRLRARLARQEIAVVLSGGNIAPEVHATECRKAENFGLAAASL